jgi:hypothetical protein
MPHIIHVAVSVSSIAVFVIMAACMVLSDMEVGAAATVSVKPCSRPI